MGSNYPVDIYTGVVFKDAASVPLDQWSWDNFRPSELACKGSGKVMIDPHSMDCLQRLRNLLGGPVRLTSAYRSPAHNKAVDGVPRSYHKLARAFDIPIDDDMPRRAFVKCALQAGFTGIGFYPRQRFIHVDTGPMRSWGDIW